MNRQQRRAAKAQGIDVGDMEVRYGGRTLQLTVVINTDETIEEVTMRIKSAASGPRQRMCVVGGGIVDDQMAKEFWEGVIPTLKQEAKRGGVC
jgi:hypothetical protein